jgi:hypothetical protein
MHEPKRIESRRNHDGSWYCVDSYVIGSPADKVFPVLLELAGYERFWPGVAIRMKAKGERTAPGARGVMTLRSGLLRMRFEFVAEEVVVGKKVRLLFSGGDATGPISLEVSRVDDACRATIIWDGVTVRARIARLFFRFLGPSAFHKASVRGLTGLERFVAAARRREPAGAAKRSFEWRGSVPGEKSS